MPFHRGGHRRAIWIGAIALLCLAAAGKPKPVRVLEVKIQATVIDRANLLARLNKDGKHRDMRFVEASGKNYAYRIVFAAGEHRNRLPPGFGGIWRANVRYSDVDVFGPTGTELFRLHEDNKYTIGGATNAAANDIIKRIRQLDKIEKSQK